MNNIFDNRLKSFQNKLKKYPTSAEIYFNDRLLERFGDTRHKKGIFVHRQILIGWYIVDFLLPHKQLIIELDGNHHFRVEGRTDDIIRDGFLKEIGFDVLRYSNQEIYKNTDDILDYIKLWRSLDDPLLCYRDSFRAIREVNRLRIRGNLNRYAKSKELR